SGRFSAETGFDWRLWPSRPAGQLSRLLEAVQDQGAQAGNISAGGSAAVDVRRDGTNLVYVLDGLRLVSGRDMSARGIPYDAWLPGVSGVLESTPPLPLGPVTLNGGTGMLSVDASHQTDAGADAPGEAARTSGPSIHELAVSGSLRQSVRAPALFSLETPVRPGTTSSGTWSESVEGQGEASVVAAASIGDLPFAFREVIDPAAGESFTLSGEGSWRVEETGASDSGARVSAEYEYSSNEGTGSDLILGLRFGLKTLGESATGGDEMAQSPVLTGELDARRTLRDLWLSTSSVGEHGLQRSDLGEESASSVATIRQESQWLPRPDRGDREATAPTLHDGADVSVLARSGLRTDQASVAPLPDGGLLAAMVLHDPARTWPNSLGISVAQMSESGEWTEARPLSLSEEGSVLDLAMARDSSGQVVMVWSELRETLDEPEEFVSDLASGELRYAVFDPASGDWTAARTLTDDARPDLSPTLAGNDGGRTLLAWTKDMDGNVLTEDDGVAYVSRWDGSEWTEPQSLMPVPAGSGELAASASGASAVVAAAQRGPDGQSNIAVSFHTSGRWSEPSTVVNAGDRDIGMWSVDMGAPGLASLVWEETAGEGATAGRLVFAQASSAGLRPSEEVASDVPGVTALDITSGSDGSPVITWAERGGDRDSSVRTAFRNGRAWAIEGPVTIGKPVVNKFQTFVLPDGQGLASVMRIADEDGSVVGSRKTALPR
ncbi:MAG: hypothetical protein ACOC5M_00885, partial [Chloroflexota bacterium]